jgi:hypothetical protein
MSKGKYSKEDTTFETLLDLHGEVFPMDNGYWTKFEAFRVEKTPQIPHGIRYSLTLHDRNNTRILGFDNAHSLKAGKTRYGTRKITWDHKHRMEKVETYEFVSASQLLEDFWKAVDILLNE